MSALDRAMQLRAQAGNTRERPNINTTPEKTIGGGAMAALGGAGAGAAVSTALGLSGPAAPIVAGLGLAAAMGGYFDS